MDELELKPVMRQHQAAACKQSPLQKQSNTDGLTFYLAGKKTADLDVRH